MILLLRHIHENENAKEYNSSSFEASLYRINNIWKVLLFKFDGFRIIIFMIKRFKIVKYS